MSIAVDKNNNIQNYLSMPQPNNTKEHTSIPPPQGHNSGQGTEINVNKTKKNSNFILKTEISRENTKIENNNNINDNLNFNENAKKIRIKKFKMI